MLFGRHSSLQQTASWLSLSKDVLSMVQYIIVIAHILAMKQI